MDEYEASRIVFSRIQGLDPENASKIMGLLFLQDYGDKEMIRLAFGPEALVLSVIVKAKKELGLISCLRPPWSSLHGPDELISPKNGDSTLNPASVPFYANERPSVDVSDDFEIHERLSFSEDDNPRADFAGSVHGRSGGCVSNGLDYDETDLGFRWGPCSYFAGGFCKDGGNCMFLHGGDHQLGGIDGGAGGVGSPSRTEMGSRNGFITSEAVPILPASRLAHQFMGGSCFPFSPESVTLQQSGAQRAAALMMGDDLQEFGRYRAERNDLSSMTIPASRQIYLTFPADSAFWEEDVSNYFSAYGPVQDVRIPYQQRRMFGFVTFVYPETVKSILAKGNPHFVCGSRVLVKPYKEKGKVPDKYRTKQTMEGDLSSPCGIPIALDSRGATDLQLGPRVLYINTRDLLWRRKFEEHAIELQCRRLMNLQLLDVEKHFHQNSPTKVDSPNPFNRTFLSPHIVNGSAENNKEVAEAFTKKEYEEDTEKGSAEEGSDATKINLPESLEDGLLDSPFALSFQHSLLFDNSVADANSNVSGSSSPSFDHDESTLKLLDSFKSFNCQMPRLSLVSSGDLNRKSTYNRDRTRDQSQGLLLSSS